MSTPVKLIAGHVDIGRESMRDRYAIATAVAATIVVAAVLALTDVSGWPVGALFVLWVAVLAGLEWARDRARRAELAVLRAGTGIERVTALGNQQSFKDDLDREILRADRSGQPLSLIVLSLDAEPWLERIDDLVRAAMAKAMVAAVRRADRGYRIGATEFALILPDTRALGGAVAARRVVGALRDTGSLDGQLSAGVAEAGPGIDRHRLFRNAYVALLAAARDVVREDVIVYAPELEPRGPDPEIDSLPRPGGAA